MVGPTWRRVLGVMAVMLVMAVPAAAQESLATARQLYSSAQYDEALTMLNTLRAGAPAARDRAPIELYRALCLVAIDEMPAATEAISAMVSRDPFYRPSPDDVPPRLRPLIAEARKRTLPSIIQERYVRAKAAFERKEVDLAHDQFTQVVLALTDPDLADEMTQPPLADLRLLATGFRDLASRAATAQTATPQTPPSVPALLSEPAPPAAAPAKVYDAADTDVAPPVARSQQVPAFPGRVTVPRMGVLDVVIGDSGTVESVAIERSIDPMYDRIIAAAARAWAYSPARRNGVPVRYRKRIEIALSPRP